MIDLLIDCFVLFCFALFCFVCLFAEQLFVDLSKMRKPTMKKMVQLQPSQPDMLFNLRKASSVAEQTRARLLQVTTKVLSAFFFFFFFFLVTKTVSHFGFGFDIAACDS